MRRNKQFFPFFVLLLMLTMASSCTESFDARCRREAREYTERECPRMIDKFIRMDSMTFESNPSTLVYYYTVLGDLDNDSLLTPEVVEDFRTSLLESIRNDINMKRYKDKGFSFSYRYTSASTGKPFIEATFAEEDYK